MPSPQYLICPKCRRQFRTQSGLRWHLFHIHKWSSTRELIKAPSQADLAMIVFEEALELLATAKGLNIDYQDLKRAVEKRFGSEAKQDTSSSSD